MTPDEWITSCVLVLVLGLLVWGRYAPSAVMFGGVLLLLLGGVIDEEQAFSGFSNAAPITVAALYVLAHAAQRTGLLSSLVGVALGRGTGIGATARLVGPSAAASAFLNNTPLVAVLIPDVVAWARRHGVAPSRYLMPLSFAVILGGGVTVLGTSTNLVVSGLLQEGGGEPLGIFEVTAIGLPVALCGLLVLLLVSVRFLPERASSPDLIAADIREFAIEMQVAPGSAIAGRSVEEAGLRHLNGVYLVQIDREGATIAPVAPTQTLAQGDVLTFVGQVANVLDLQRMPGLQPSSHGYTDELRHSRNRLFEVVVGRTSPVAGRTLPEADFRARYGAAVLAIHRSGARIDSKLGDVRLRHGDTLVVLADPRFRARWGSGHDFLVTAPFDAPAPAATRQAPLVAAVLVAFVGLSAAGVLSVVVGALLAAAALVALKVVTFSGAKRAVDLDVVLMIAAAFGVGSAVASSGLAERIASAFVEAFAFAGTAGLVFGIVLTTSLLTEFVTNNAAAVVVFPIAISIAGPAGVDPRVMAVGVALAASSSFLTPVGYQTNTMVYGPGGYRFADFLRVGGVVNIVVTVAITAGVVMTG